MRNGDLYRLEKNIFTKIGQDIFQGEHIMEQNLELKKETLTAWARILYNKGIIDTKRCNAMIQKIDRLTN